MSPYQSLRQSADFAALCEVSARIGADPLQVQAAGGNTSLKAENAMWVKASGTWLADAQRHDIMVPVDAGAMRAALERGDPQAQSPAPFTRDDENRSGLRGSIETAVHAIIPQRTVLHTHCVASIALAVQQDAQAQVAARLGDLGAVFVPYIQPGADLALAIAKRLEPTTRVIVLGNHGLIAAAQTPHEAEALLAEVRQRLCPADLPDAPGTDLAQRLAGTGWEAVDAPSLFALAADPARLALANGGTLYPDHLIFLGPGIVLAQRDESPDQAVARVSGDGPARKLVLLPGLGGAVPKGAGRAAHALARCLGDVLIRANPGAPVRYLSPAQEAALLNWDAEKYRQSLDTTRRRQRDGQP